MYLSEAGMIEGMQQDNEFADNVEDHRKRKKQGAEGGGEAPG